MYEIEPRLIDVIAGQPYPLIFVTISGAHLYGFPSPDSDYDLRGVHLLPLKELVGLDTGKKTIEFSNWESQLQIDLVTHEIKKFFGLLLNRNGYVLEQLYSPLVVRTTPEHQELKEIAKGCMTRHHSHHYLGFAKTQWKLFQQDNPPKVKPLLYVYRVLLTGIHLMQTGLIEANLITLNQKFQLSYLPELINLKITATETEILHQIDRTFHEQEFMRLCRVLEEASQKSFLPDKASARSHLHDLLIRLRLHENMIYSSF